MLTITHAAAALALLLPLASAPEAADRAAGTAEAVSLQPADLPDASSLFDAFIEATGGLAAHQRQKDRTLEGEYRNLVENDTQVLRVYASAPNNFRVELEAPALGTTIRCTNGETAWGTNLSGKPFLLNTQERIEILDNGIFLSEAAYKERYSKITTESLVKVEGRDAYRVAFETASGLAGAVYFDAETKLLLAREIIPAAGPSNSTIVLVSDYKDVGGILMPMKQVQRLTSQAKPTVEINFRWTQANTGDMPSFDPPAELTAPGEG